MTAPSPSPDDLLVLLMVARSGRYTAAARRLGVSHVTVSRRVEALERALGGKVLTRAAGGWDLTPLGARALATAERLDEALRDLTADLGTEGPVADVVRVSAPEAFCITVGAPAAARLHRRRPWVAVEIISATRRAAQYRSGIDLEVVVAKAPPAGAIPLGGYRVGLFASPDYLANCDMPRNLGDLLNHRLVYFVPSMIQVDDLDVGHLHLPDMQNSVTSTSVLAQVEATRCGAGIGLLPTFLAGAHDDLVRLLPQDFEMTMEYWVVSRPDTLRRPAVASLLDDIQTVMTSIDGLLPPRAMTPLPGTPITSSGPCWPTPATTVTPM